MNPASFCKYLWLCRILILPVILPLTLFLRNAVKMLPLLWEPAMVYRTLIPSVCHLLSLDSNLEWSHCFRKALFLHATAAEIQDSSSLAWSPWGAAWSTSLCLSTSRRPLQGVNRSRGAPFTELPPLGKLLWPFGLTRCQRPSNKALAEHCVLSRETFCNGLHLCHGDVSFLCLSSIENSLFLPLKIN